MEKDNSECIIACDYNIDLLKLNEKEVYGEFFDNLTENGFYLKITLSTRFSKKKHGILINNFYYKLTESTLDITSGILIFFKSDHQPYFTFFNSISQHTAKKTYISKSMCKVLKQ